jgi:fructose-1,6-bisphosphatase/inositol monophosphatase family enzyme
LNQENIQSEVFETRRKHFSEGFGKVAGFVLAAVYGAMEIILSLGNKKGRQVVATRAGQYRYWDPETILVDKVSEGYLLKRVRQVFGKQAAVLSEEIGRSPNGGEIQFYVISDPFDGSLLYKRGIPDFWFTSLAIYTASGAPLAAAVCDVAHGIIYFCNDLNAYSGRFIDGKLEQVTMIQTASTANLKEAVFETYLMKAPRLYPACEVLKPLLEQVTFILPNGGPAGYADVASGRVDVYLAVEESHIENFSAIPIALQAGAVVTDFDGNEVVFEDQINKRYFIVCSANEHLHEQVLRQLDKIHWKEHPHYKAILEENQQFT